jgi:hypothetical protein
LPLALKFFISNNLKQRSMTALARITQEQSLQDFLIQEMNDIYYEGYAEEIIASEPDKFTFELAELKAQFSDKK